MSRMQYFNRFSIVTLRFSFQSHAKFIATIFDTLNELNEAIPYDTRAK